MKRPPLVNTIITALLAFFTIVIGLLSSIVTIVLPSSITPYLHYAIPLLGSVTLIYLGLTMWQTWRQSSKDDGAELTKSEHYRRSIEKQNRQRMMEKVRAYWITGVLEQSLHSKLIALGLHEQPEAVAVKHVIQQLNQSERVLPSGTSIIQAYEDSGDELLILGEPGSGKTTLMLELTRFLLINAVKDDSCLIPVIFNLSSWAVKRKLLADWLIDELNTKYQVPIKLGQSWINNNQILPLLDGLDEVVPDARTACIDTINSYRKEHGIVPTVVCCRTSEYMALTTRISLYNAVIIQPLTKEQIDDYLSSAGGQLAAIRLALREDPDLQELAASPLMLDIMALAYRGMPVGSLPLADSIGMRRRQIFATYIKQMIQRRDKEARYKPQQTMHWLIELAQQMVKHNETEFYLERMQPNWLSGTLAPILYRAILAGIVGGLCGGLFVGAILGLNLGLLASLFGILSCGLLIGIFGKKIGKIPIGLGIGVIFGLIFGLLGDLNNERLGGLLGNGLGGIFVGVLMGNILDGFVVIIEDEIKPAETMKVSWLNMLKSMFAGLFMPRFIFLSITLGVLLAIISSLRGGDLISDLNNGLLACLSGLIFLSMLYGLLIGMALQMMETHSFVKPNQGIRNSARNSSVVGILSGFLSIMMYLFIIDILHLSPPVPFSNSIFLLLFIIVGIIMFAGGTACFAHFVLRLLLWCNKYTPVNYPHFLDYAADCILLRKVGGGYIFVHRLLLEYFATLER